MTVHRGDGPEAFVPIIGKFFLLKLNGLILYSRSFQTLAQHESRSISAQNFLIKFRSCHVHQSQTHSSSSTLTNDFFIETLLFYFGSGLEAAEQDITTNIVLLEDHKQLGPVITDEYNFLALRQVLLWWNESCHSVVIAWTQFTTLTTIQLRWTIAV